MYDARGCLLAAFVVGDFPPLCFSCSTCCFHFLTISFARSDTTRDACERSFPTARPALLSCGDGVSLLHEQRRGDTPLTRRIASVTPDRSFRVWRVPRMSYTSAKRTKVSETKLTGRQ